jgi:HD-like signal output (HDOD) protein
MLLAILETVCMNSRLESSFISDDKLRPDDIETRMKIEIRDIGIPPRPTVLAQIQAESAKDDPDFINLARILSQDVGLSASLIKVANSPYFSFGKKVPTVHEAMLVLGLKLVVNTVAGLALQQVFKHVPNLEDFWNASASNAHAANWLTRKIGPKCGIRPEDAYTFALFRDCGIPVLLIPFPEYQSTLTAAGAEKELSFTEVEDHAMGINHAHVGAEMAANWLLPEEICLAIRHHHDCEVSDAGPSKLPERSKALIALSHVAEYLAQQKNGKEATSEWEKLGAACLACLGIDDEKLAVLSEDFTAKFANH